jgi:MFS family permease
VSHKNKTMSFLINFSLLKRSRNFRLLFFGYLISLFGTAMTGVALPYQIYTSTHSTLMVGLLSLAQLVPLLFTALWGGALVDAKNPTALANLSFVLLGIGSSLLTLNAIFFPHFIWPLFFISAAISAVTGLLRPAIGSLRQLLVEKKDFPEAGSLMLFISSFSMIAGPALGGLIIAHLGVSLVFLCDALSYVVAVIAFLAFKNIPHRAKAAKQSSWKAIFEGFRYAASRQELLGTCIVDFVAMVFGMPTALFPAIALSFGGAKTLGLLYSAPAVGALFASFLSGWAEKIKRHGIAISIAASLWGVAIVFFGVISNFWVALFFLMLAGGFDAISALFRGIMWNESIPHEFRGRLAGIEMISYLSGPKLGDTESGLVAAAFGVGASVISGGVLCVIGVFACCYFMPKFVKYRSLL